MKSKYFRLIEAREEKKLYTVREREGWTPSEWIAHLRRIDEMTDIELRTYLNNDKRGIDRLPDEGGYRKGLGQRKSYFDLVVETYASEGDAFCQKIIKDRKENRKKVKENADKIISGHLSFRDVCAKSDSDKRNDELVNRLAYRTMTAKEYGDFLKDKICVGYWPPEMLALKSFDSGCGGG